MKKIVIISISFFLLYGFLSAVDFNKFGFKVIENKIDLGKSVVTLQTDKNRTFILSTAAEPTDTQLQSVVAITDTVFSWNLLKVGTLKISFTSPDSADILVIPQVFAYNGKDFIPFLPAGIQFQYSTYLSYDFRIRVNNLFVRMKGQFFTEDQFGDRLSQATSDPVKYIQSSDPDYIVKQLAENQMKLNDQVEIIEAQKIKLAELEKQVNNLQRTILTFNNTGVFKGPTPMPEDILQSVIQLKKTTPTLSVTDVMVKMKERSLNATIQDVKLIFEVFFNDFSEK